MTALAIVSDGADSSAELLLEAAGRLGISVGSIDLRRDHLSLKVGEKAEVTLNGSALAVPAVVVNTTVTNGLGLAGGAALLRQQSTRWQYRHFAAREEQGLLLAIFGHWHRHGSTLVNGTRAADLALMPNAVIERLHRGGIAVNRRSTGDCDTEVLVAGGRGIIHRGAAPGGQEMRTAIAVASFAEFNLGSVRLVRDPSGRPVVTGWAHQPLLSAWPNPGVCAVEILRSFPALEERPGATRADPFFVHSEAWRPVRLG